MDGEHNGKASPLAVVFTNQQRLNMTGLIAYSCLAAPCYLVSRPPSFLQLKGFDGDFAGDFMPKDNSGMFILCMS